MDETEKIEIKFWQRRIWQQKNANENMVGSGGVYFWQESGDAEMFSYLI